jgi:hypothetical protein
LIPPTRFPLLMTPHVLALFGGIPYLMLVPALIAAVALAGRGTLSRIRKMAPLAHVAVVWVFMAYVSRNGNALSLTVARMLLMGSFCLAIDYFYLAIVMALRRGAMARGRLE